MFMYKGTTLSIKHFFAGYGDYIPDAMSIVKDLGIDTLRVYGAGFSQFNMANPDWAEKLKSFLDLCGDNGVKVVFHHMADWRFGCTSTHEHAQGPINPWPFGIEIHYGIADAKSKIDMLAGNNSLGHNFLVDSRIPFWILLNEPFFDVYTDSTLVLDWVREIATYMKSKGAKVAVGYGSIHGGVTTPSEWVPLINDYVDYVIFHWYGGSIAVDAQNRGVSVFDAVYASLKNTIGSYRLVVGAKPLIIGEIGMQHGREGTEETRGHYYRAIFQACNDSNVSLFPFTLFDMIIGAPGEEVVMPWGAVAHDGTYYVKVTDQYKMFYVKPVGLKYVIPTILVLGVVVALLGGGE